MKKIVFFDLDGTLLTSKKEILQENIEAIKRAREHRIEVCICSGRPQSAVRKYQKDAEAGRYIICANGAEIYDTEEEEQLFSASIEEELCVKLFEFVTQNNLFVRIDTSYGRYVNIEEYKILNDIFFDEDYKKFFKENKVLQISIGAGDSTIIDELVETLKLNPNIAIANRFMSEMLPIKLDILNIVNSCVSKGNAILGLCKYLKIEPRDAIGFGDDNNDISMMKAVGYGVAMENAFDSVKELAKEVITTNNEPGIAKFLDRLILENNSEL